MAGRRDRHHFPYCMEVTAVCLQEGSLEWELLRAGVPREDVEKVAAAASAWRVTPLGRPLIDRRSHSISHSFDPSQRIVQETIACPTQHTTGGGSLRARLWSAARSSRCRRDFDESTADIAVQGLRYRPMEQPGYRTGSLYARTWTLPDSTGAERHLSRLLKGDTC